MATRNESHKETLQKEFAKPTLRHMISTKIQSMSTGLKHYNGIVLTSESEDVFSKILLLFVLQ